MRWRTGQRLRAKPVKFTTISFGRRCGAQEARIRNLAFALIRGRSAASDAASQNGFGQISLLHCAFTL
jgi:hypothetical protein